MLQIELLKLQAWIDETGQKVCIVFEGRDAAGKGGTIKRFIEHLNPRGATVVALGVPTETEQGQWYFQRWIRHLPTAGQIVLFDRSWYTRAVVERVMGYCTAEQYVEFLRHVPEFERLLQASDTTIVKLWFSVSRKEQVTRFTIRRIDPVRQWKLSPSDLASLDRWDDLHGGEGSDVPPHRHDVLAVDGRSEQRQEARSSRGHPFRAVPIRLPGQGPPRRRRT